jgi:hypothetical protein
MKNKTQLLRLLTDYLSVRTSENQKLSTNQSCFMDKLQHFKILSILKLNCKKKKAH